MATKRLSWATNPRSRACLLPMLLLALTLILISRPMVRARTTIRVNTNDHELNNDGDCSLWEAIVAANTDAAVDACPAGSGADVIFLEAPFPVYTLTTSLPTITTEMEIRSNHSRAERSWIERSQAPGTPDFRILDVSQEGNLTMVSIAVRFGKSGSGAGIFNRGIATLIDCPIFDNDGSGILNWGMAALYGCQIFENDLAGIANGGTANLTNSVVRANNLSGIVNAGTMTLHECTISDNVAFSGGGGIENRGMMTLGECTISGNTVTVDRAYGAGIYNTGTMTLGRCTIKHNIASGGIQAAGGGIYNGGTATLVNSTVSNNEARGSQGVFGGGIFVISSSATVTLTNCTIAHNSVSGDLVVSGGGILNLEGDSTVLLKNTIVADNLRTGDPDNCGGQDGITDGGHNLQFPGTNCGSSIPTADPRLAPLGLYPPGKTETYALNAGSAAIDAGDNNACPATDQRGVIRPLGPACDIGAYEAPFIVTFGVEALIEGRSRLIVRVPTYGGPTDFQWHHIRGVAPGRFDGSEAPTFINSELWFPVWPDNPDTENRDCDCRSSQYYTTTSSIWPYTVYLGIVEARGGENSVRIVHAPRGPDDSLVVEFDDTSIDGAAWYRIKLFYVTTGWTAIDLLSFTAQAGTDHVTLAWETGTEVDNAGFNLWRSEAADGPYAKINDTLIPAEGDAVSGASYTYVDADVVAGVTYYYKLEDVDIHGVSTFHGPVSARPGRPHLTYLPIVLR